MPDTIIYLVELTGPNVEPARELVDVDQERAELPQALEAVERMARDITAAMDAAGETPESEWIAWDRMLDEIERDRERAADLDPSGVRYALPDGRSIEATRLDVATLDAMALGFWRACAWTDAIPLEMDDNGETGGLEDREATAELVQLARDYCARFLAANADDVRAHLEAFGDPDGGHPGEYVGHTFYLDAAGHGASFTDRAWRDDDPMTAVCKRLRDAADGFGDIEHLGVYEQGNGKVGLG